MGKYSETLMDHFSSPGHVGRIESPDLVGLAGTPGQGPFMVLQLRVRNGVIVEAKYQTHGCGVTIAAGSMLTEMITNCPVSECLELTPDRLAEALGGVPPDKAHSAVLAIAALKNALKS